MGINILKGMNVTECISFSFQRKFKGDNLNKQETRENNQTFLDPIHCISLPHYQRKESYGAHKGLSTVCLF